MKDIQPGDILDKNIRVIGIVEIDNSDLQNVYEYNLGNGCIFKGGCNLHICDKTL